MKVKDIMTANTLMFCSPETELQNAAKKMKDGNCGALPVVDKDKKVLGIITDRDICLTLADKQAKSPAQMTVGQIMPKKSSHCKT
jgi:CBS domain-containing protein